MGALGNTNVDIASARNLYGGSGQVAIDETNMRYLAGKPQSASGSTISFDDIKGAAYIATSSGGTSIDVRASAIAAGWNGAGPLWFILTGNTYSGSTGTASLVVSGSFPKGLILQINSGVIVSGKGGDGAAGTYGTGATGNAGGVALAVSSYTGGTLYINNLGTLAGGGGGGGSGGGNAPYYAAGYTVYPYGGTPYYVNPVYFAVVGTGGGGGSGVGAGGASYYAGQQGSAGTISAGGAGGANPGQLSDGVDRGAGGAGGGPGSAGSGGNLSSHTDYNAYYNYTYYYVASYGGAGGGAGACTTGTVAASAVWLNTGTRYGTVG